MIFHSKILKGVVMLQLIDIKKDYLSGADKVEALRGISLSFRENEFVSILGPSGCGKTTLLNIVGGLDHYTDGDLIINGKSTKDFTDRDWDSYRNHSIGFIFQSYNLIPHQSVLANVELALTLSGVSKTERRKKAVAALEKVGLKDQIKKRPNQLSGGQMQRVAIARALVNDPDILLADEPTGALDTVTSVQIMELLKEIAKDRLVIMVTHNPELAEEYSTRIIRLLDGKMTDDSMPFVPEKEKEETTANKASTRRKTSMSLWTAFSLSMNNLMTKKGRTILTSFAGSIGIIGIALILSLSNGINAYINHVQEDTLSSYPISIQAETVDMSALMLNLMGLNQATEGNRHELDAVYSSNVMGEMINSLNNAQMQTNNLEAFKKYLEENEEIQSYISNLQYSYDLNMKIYTKDVGGNIVSSDVEKMMQTIFSEIGFSEGTSSSSSISSMGFGSIQLWQEMLPNKDGTGISSLLTDQYDVIYGHWPKDYTEVVLVVNEQNELSDLVLGGLGLKTIDEMVDEFLASQRGETLDTSKKSWSYEEICQKEFKVFLPTDLYQKNPNGGYTLLTDAEKGLEYLFANQNKGVTVKISGIIRQKEDAIAGMMTGALGYTTALTDHLISKAVQSDMLLEQQNHPEMDIILNLPFLPKDFTEDTDDVKIQKIREYLAQLSIDKKAEIYRDIATVPSDEYLQSAITAAIGSMSRADLEGLALQFFTAQQGNDIDVSYIQEYVKQMSDQDLYNAIAEVYAMQIKENYKKEVELSLANRTKEELAGMLDLMLSNPEATKDEAWLSLYDAYMPATHSKSNLENNLDLLGLVSKDRPSAIHIYADSFENKDMISEMISDYNDTKEKEDQIEYTDFVALLMSSIATVINAISYVLIAFVSISLIVSSIMIGIITYISVLERTKEIGILRAIGASKKDVSRVFNAESFIEGLIAGLLGIGITLLLIIPINAVIRYFTEIPTLGAELPLGGYLLILVSVLLSYVAGLIPSRLASKKDPVEALRTE